VATASTPREPHSDACDVESGINYDTKHVIQGAGGYNKTPNTYEKQQE
jgi:hypothetical protein